jgi:hypothetical protein
VVRSHLGNGVQAVQRRVLDNFSDCKDKFAMYSKSWRLQPLVMRPMHVLKAGGYNR